MDARCGSESRFGNRIVTLQIHPPDDRLQVFFGVLTNFFRYGQVDIAKELLERGADISALGGGPMKEALKANQTEVISFLKKQGLAFACISSCRKEEESLRKRGSTEEDEKEEGIGVNLQFRIHILTMGTTSEKLLCTHSSKSVGMPTAT